MRLVADENVSQRIIERLRAGGFEVLSIGEASSGASDEDVLNIAAREQRVLLTEDRDFGELVIRQRRRVLGLILLELDRIANASQADLIAQTLNRTRGSAFGQFVGDR